MHHKPIKAVLFDFGGTLLNFHDEDRIARLYVRIFKQHGFVASFARVKAARRIELRAHLKATYGDPNRHGKPEIVMGRVLGRLGLTVSHKTLHTMAKRFSRENARHYKLYPGVRRTLAAIKKSGYTIALVSNGSMPWTMRYLKKFRIAKLIDAVFVSEDLRAEKSSLTPFRAAMKELHLTSEECLMVGDRLDEDMHARKLGIRTCWAAYGPRLPVVGERVKPDFRINDIRELPALLKIFSRR